MEKMRKIIFVLFQKMINEKDKLVYSIIVDDQFQRAKKIKQLNEYTILFSEREEDQAILAILDWIIQKDYFETIHSIHSYDGSLLKLDLVKKLGFQIFGISIDVSNVNKNSECKNESIQNEITIDLKQSIIYVDCIFITKNKIMVQVSGLLNGILSRSFNVLQNNEIKTIRYGIYGLIHELKNQYDPVYIETLDVDRASVFYFDQQKMNRIEIVADKTKIGNCLNSNVSTNNPTNKSWVIDCIDPDLNSMKIYTSGFRNEMIEYKYENILVDQPDEMYLKKENDLTSTIIIVPNSRMVIDGKNMKNDSSICKSNLNTKYDELSIYVKNYCFYQNEKGEKSIRLNNFIEGNSVIKSTKSISISSNSLMSKKISYRLEELDSKITDDVPIGISKMDMSNNDSLDEFEQPKLREAREKIIKSIIYLFKTYKVSSNAVIDIKKMDEDTTIVVITDGENKQVLSIDTSFAFYDSKLCHKIDEEQVMYNSKQIIDGYCFNNNKLFYTSTTQIHYKGVEISVDIPLSSLDSIPYHLGTMEKKTIKLDSSVQRYLLASQYLLEH